MDKAVISETMRDLEHDFEFKRKDIMYFPDNNQSGSYNQGQVTFDLSALAGNTSYAHFREGSILIPLVMNLSGAVAGNLTQDVANAFALSLKNGYWNVLDSYNVTINGVTKKETCRYENLDISYRVNSTFSQDDLTTMGPSMGFSKDSSPFQYFSAGNATNNGLGECGNVTLVKALDTPSIGYNATGSNFFANGRWNRMQTTAMNIGTATNYGTLTKSAVNLQNENRNYCVSPNSANEIIYYVTAVIPLKLFPIFESLPLMRGARISLNLFTNTNCSCTFQTLGGAGIIGFSQTGFNIQSNNGQFPMQISAPQNGALKACTTGFNPIAGANEIFTCGIAIARSHSSTTPVLGVSPVYTHTIPNCRLYLPLYIPSDTLAERLTASGGMLKNVVYRDIQNATYLNVPPNQQFTYVFPSFIQKPRYLLICPFLSSLCNGATNPGAQNLVFTNGVNVGSPLISPFTSAPGTVSPYLTVTNFSVLLNQRNLFQQPRNYNWECFSNEVRPSNAINGGITPYGLTNGLISEEDYNSHGYNYIYVDLSRHTQSEDNMATQIQISGNNNSLVPVDYYIFVAYERSFVINCSTGQINQ